ncbi:MAG: tRNA epoxyqueuosine(34) reductase QueG [Ottowia sp.]|nr:tRNA epoxyqueuosine(34) reductase QueG [Ottowia sp.]
MSNTPNHSSADAPNNLPTHPSPQTTSVPANSGSVHKAHPQHAAKKEPIAPLVVSTTSPENIYAETPLAEIATQPPHHINHIDSAHSAPIVTTSAPRQIDLVSLAAQIKQWGQALGFAEIRITDTDVSLAQPYLAAWLAKDMHGEMAYMAKQGEENNLRTQPSALVPGTLRIISARMDYLPSTSQPNWRDHELNALTQPDQAVISLYARGRDYHKTLRQRLQKLAQKISEHIGPLGYRAFTDSAPVMEVELARKAGLGWRGKHTLLLSRQGGSLFFLGELFVDLPLPTDEHIANACGHCTRCIDICPTQAIIAPYQLDARRCISYLTIENPGPIPEALRPLMGNRIYGCDDCQLICPWNKYAQHSPLDEFSPRNQLDSSDLLTLFAWNEHDFSHRLAGSAIRRIGHIRWLRNIAVALGNALRVCTHPAQAQRIQSALQNQATHPSELVQEHVHWALAQGSSTKKSALK